MWNRASGRTAFCAIGLSFLALILTIGPAAECTAAEPGGPVPLLTVGRAKAQPKIDGRLDDECWQLATTVPVFVDWETAQPAPITTTAKAAWDDEACYVAFVCEEPEPTKIKPRAAKHDDPVWGEDSVEIFIRPRAIGSYFHVMCSTRAVIADAAGTDAQWDSGVRAAADKLLRDGEERGWTVEMAIPWENLGGAPKAGETWTGNFNRGRHVGPEQLWAWSCTNGGFHNPARFGKIVFDEHPAIASRIDPGQRRPGRNSCSVDVLVPPDPPGAALEILLGEKEERVATVPVPGAGRVVTLRAGYSLGCEAGGRVILRVGAADRCMFLMSFPPAIALPEELRNLPDRITMLGEVEKKVPGTFQVEIDRLRTQGQRLLSEVDQTVAAAEKAGRVVTDKEWAAAIEPLKRFSASLGGPVLWTKPALADSRPTSMPERLAEKCVLKVAAVQGEREPASLMISNLLCGTRLDLKLRLGRFNSLATGQAHGPAELDVSRISFSEAGMIRSQARGTIGDAMIPLDPAGRVCVPPGESREVWMTLDTRNAEPGYHLGSIIVSPLDESQSISPKTVDVRIRILPVKLPETMPIGVFNWDYSKGARDRRCLEDLLDHYVNVFQITGVPGPGEGGHADFSGLDPLIRQVHPHGLIFFEVWFMRKGWKPEFANWVRDLAAYTRSRGLDYDDWVLHIFDETLNDKFLESAQQIKKTDPKVRIFTDMMGDVERLRQFSPCVDYWCPHYAALHKPGLDYMRQTGKPIWTYECGSGKRVTPVMNRALVWRAWAYGLDGVSFWTYPSAYGSYWNDYDSGRSDWAKIYVDSHGGPLPSKRWQAWREGLEDYLLLTVLESELARSGLADARIPRMGATPLGRPQGKHRCGRGRRRGRPRNTSSLRHRALVDVPGKARLRGARSACQVFLQGAVQSPGQAARL